jgi:hypothetical protein
MLTLEDAFNRARDPRLIDETSFGTWCPTHPKVEVICKLGPAGWSVDSPCDCGAANLARLGLADGTVKREKPSDLQWQIHLRDQTIAACERAIKDKPEVREAFAVAELDGFVSLVGNLRNIEGDWQSSDPEGLSETEIQEQVEVIAREVQKKYWVPALSNGHALVSNARSLVIEDQEDAKVMNDEYRARPEIIKGLGFAPSIALMIGGKHHGKTTNTRTAAMSIMRGVPLWGRETTQGHVIYVASDDEIASTRNELLEMGWRSKADPLLLVRLAPDVETTTEKVLDEIAELAIKNKTILIVLDMLFDFAGIRDELSYAGTRAGAGLIQRLADQTKALVLSTHHTPKYLTDVHSAENAALGSQGISARFSPIILTRKWSPNLFTVESTTIRDPRGVPLPPTKITKNAQGWIETVGPFREWMKWEIYAQRVLDLFDGNKGHTVYDIAEKLNLDRPRAQNTLKELTTQGKLRREKEGRSYKYYLSSSDMFQREGGNWSSDE